MCLEHNVVQPLFLPTLDMPFSACWWLFWLAAHWRLYCFRDTTGRGGRPGLYSPSLEGRVLTIGATTSWEGFWGVHLLQEVLHPSRTSAFRRGSLQMLRKEIVSFKEAQKNVRETWHSRGAKLFNWCMQRVTTGRHNSHKMDKQMVRDRVQKHEVWQARRQLVGPVVRMVRCPGSEGLYLHLP